MGVIAVPNTFSANTTISSSQVNANFSTIYNEFNGSIAAANLASDSVVTAKIADSNVTTAKLADAAITPEKLLTGTGTSWAWQDWTPTLTNLSGGTLNYAKYIQIGKTVHFMLRYTLGGAGVAGIIGFSPPVNMSATLTTNTDSITGGGQLQDATGSRWIPWMRWGSASRIDILYASGDAIMVAPSSTAPFTWAVNDVVMVTGTYEAA